MAQLLKSSSYEKDYSINRVYLKPYTKVTEHPKKSDKGLASQPFSATREKKPIQIHLTGSTKIPKVNEQPKLNTADTKTTNSQVSNWNKKYKYTERDSRSEAKNVTSGKSDPVDIATKIARTLRLKELKKQIERETSAKIVSSGSEVLVSTASTQKNPLTYDNSKATTTAVSNQKQYSKLTEKEQRSNSALDNSRTLSTSKQNYSQSKVISSSKQPTNISLNPIISSTNSLCQEKESKKTNQQTNPLSKNQVASLPVLPMVPRFPITPLQPQGLGIPSQGMYPIQAQTMMSMQRQTLPQPLFRANWQPIATNMVGLGMPNIMPGCRNILGVQNPILIPDNIVGVPEILRMQESNDFNPDDFEPPDFDSCSNATEGKSAQQSEIRNAITPPPGVAMEEFVKEHNSK